jgi:hypothetical protein
MNAVIFACTLAACAFLLWQQRAHYESLLGQQRAGFADQLDRAYYRKGEPPAGADMKEVSEARAAGRAQHQRSARKVATDPTAHLRKTLAEEEVRPPPAA